METRCFGCMQLKEKHPICEHCGFDETIDNNEHQLSVGTVVGGQYLLGRVLGQGGFGITYLGWDQVMNQRVAVKEYFPKGYASRTHGNTRVTSYDGQNAKDFEHNKQRFLREAESLAKLWDIPQIVKILRYFEENGTAYIVMEYARGINLRDHLKKLGRPLTVDETLFLLGPIMKALGLIHDIHLVHRDIAPDNIMVLPNGSTKLLDFGAARYVENANAEQERATSTQAILKNGFAPPEQYQTHGALGPWTDEYAMCATIYFCMTGKVPPEAMSRIIEGKEIDWDRADGLNTRQLAALKKGLAISPRDRFASVAELWKELKANPGPKPEPSKPAPEQPEPIPEPEPPKSTPITEPSRLAPAPAGNHRNSTVAIAAVVLAAAIGLFAFSPKRKADVKIESTVPVIETTAPTAPAVIYTFEENDAGLILTGYEGELPEDLILPGVYDGKKVTQIGKAAFKGCTGVVNITIPDNVSYIGEEAFAGCTDLKRIVIPDAITRIASSTFAACRNLTNINIPDSVTDIGSSAFEDCTSLENIAIPESVASIGHSAFENTAWLNGETGDFVICADAVLIKYKGSETRVTVPPEVKTICGAFRGNDEVTHITISKGVKTIGSSAFYDCSSLTAVTIPDSVTSIGSRAFGKCTSLTGVTIPNSVTSIGYSAFSQCTSLTNIAIPNGVKYFENCLFEECTTLTYISIPNGVTSFGYEVFKGCTSLNSITIPNSVTHLGYSTFSGCTRLSGVNIPSGVTEIQDGVFGGCTNLTYITIPDGVTYIGNDVFTGTGLTSITIPKSVKTLGFRGVFSGCKNLKNAYVPKEMSSATLLFAKFPDTCTIHYY